MRHASWIACLVVALLVGVRVAALRREGEALRADEVAARAVVERIFAAEIGRSRAPPAGDPIGPFAFLSTLVAEGRLAGLAPVAAAGERDVWRAGDYLFLVRLLTPLGRPLARRPDDPSREQRLGSDFELWAWPVNRSKSSLALYFASDAGQLYQGDNGRFAGPSAHPESGDPPSKRLQTDPDLADDDWIAVASLAR